MPFAVTVAAIIEREGRFLMVEELDAVDNGHVLNQPAGHVDPGEDLLTAVLREAHEEAGICFTPEHVVGVYLLRARDGKSYLRVAFCGSIPASASAAPIDSDILACHWLSRDEIAAARPRSSLVLRCIDDYLAGQRLPLAAITGVYNDQ